MVKVTGKRIVMVGVFMFLIGFVLVYGPSIFNILMYGRWPEPMSYTVAVGNILMIAGPWVIRARAYVRRSVN